MKNLFRGGVKVPTGGDAALCREAREPETQSA